MDFVYAEKLKSLFSVFGHFYDLTIGDTTFKCRSILEITAKDIDDPSLNKPCAVVVMMNPGSSRPLDWDYKPKTFTIKEITKGNWEKEIVPTRPDNAQYQIMRLMLLKNWKHVRVLNLSDLRNGNSGKFAVEFGHAASIDASNPHCMVHTLRRKELLDYCNNTGVVIAAWGANEVLKSTADEFLRIIPEVQGLPQEYPWYKYPSPYIKEQKMQWLEGMDNAL